VAKTKVKPTAEVAKTSKAKMTAPVVKAATPKTVEPTIAPATEADIAQTPLTGKALLQKVKDLAHLAKRETAKQCGYVKTSASGSVRTDLSGFYDAVLAAKGVKLDETSKDGRGKVATYKATVHKNGQLLIGAAYTRGMGLKEGDTFTIKLGYKHIHLIQDN
jgi:AbrB-like transcriptional regulator